MGGGGSSLQIGLRDDLTECNELGGSGKRTSVLLRSETSDRDDVRLSDFIDTHNLSIQADGNELYDDIIRVVGQSVLANTRIILPQQEEGRAMRPSPRMAHRLTMMLTEIDESQREFLLKWFVEALGITSTLAEAYTNTLFSKGIGTIEKLKRKLTTNRRYLNDMQEFDRDDASEIVRLLIKVDETPKEEESTEEFIWRSGALSSSGLSEENKALSGHRASQTEEDLKRSSQILHGFSDPIAPDRILQHPQLAPRHSIDVEPRSAERTSSSYLNERELSVATRQQATVASARRGIVRGGLEKRSEVTAKIKEVISTVPNPTATINKVKSMRQGGISEMRLLAGDAPPSPEISANQNEYGVIKGRSGRNELIRSCKAGDFHSVARLLQSGGDFTEQDRDGWTALTWASFKGYTEIVELLLGVGADPNKRDKCGLTPLMYATNNGHVDCVELCLAMSVTDINPTEAHALAAELCRSNNKKIFAHHTISEEEERLSSKPLLQSPEAQVLLHSPSHREEGDMRLSSNISSLQPTALFADTGFIITGSLQQLPADMDRKDANKLVNSKGKTLLMAACQNGNAPKVSLLLNSGADASARDNDGWTALTWASFRGSVDCVYLLLMSGGVDVNTRDKSGITPLIYATNGGHIECIKLLVMAGADVAAKAKNGWTASMRAVHSDVKQALKFKPAPPRTGTEVV